MLTFFQKHLNKKFSLRSFEETLTDDMFIYTIHLDFLLVNTEILTEFLNTSYAKLTKFFYSFAIQYQHKIKKIKSINANHIEKTCYIWFYQLIKSLNTLHSKKVIHKKISIQQILFERDLIKLDFNVDCAILKPENNGHVVVRDDSDEVFYTCPELTKQKKQISQKYDIW